MIALGSLLGGVAWDKRSEVLVKTVGQFYAMVFDHANDLGLPAVLPSWALVFSLVSEVRVHVMQY